MEEKRLKSFIIRNNHNGIFSIIEVEYEKLPDSYSFPNFKLGEWYGKIISPKSLFEKDKTGKLISPILCWFSFNDSVEDAIKTIAKWHFDEKKVLEGKIVKTYSDEEVLEIIKKIKIERL